MLDGDVATLSRSDPRLIAIGLVNAVPLFVEADEVDRGASRCEGNFVKHM